MERDLSTLAWTPEVLNDQYNPFPARTKSWQKFKEGLTAGLKREMFWGDFVDPHAFEMGYKVGLKY